MSLKSRLRQNECLIGGWAMIGNPNVTEIMAISGVDWICIDFEHTSITLAQAEDMIRATDVHSVPALIRLTSNNEDQIKRVMDIGAYGIIVPMVKNAEDAQSAIKAMRYPPHGHRGVSLHRGTQFGETFASYQEWLEKHSVCVVQIEHIDAIDNLESIFSIDGVDAYFIGPYDLSASMGLTGQLDHPDVVAAIRTVRKIASKHEKPGGLHIVEPNQQKLDEAIQSGFTFLAYSIDTMIIRGAYTNMIASLSR